MKKIITILILFSISSFSAAAKASSEPEWQTRAQENLKQLKEQISKKKYLEASQKLTELLELLKVNQEKIKAQENPNIKEAKKAVETMVSSIAMGKFGDVNQHLKQLESILQKFKGE